MTHWHIRTGTTTTDLTDAATVPRSGYETLARVRPARVVLAQALDKNGRILATTTPQHA